MDALSSRVTWLTLLQVMVVAGAYQGSKLHIVVLDTPGFRERVEASNGTKFLSSRSSFRKQATDLHRGVLSSALGSSTSHLPLHQYSELINGFSVPLTSEEAEILRGDSRVLAVVEDRRIKLATTRSYSFLGLDSKTKGVWRKTTGRNAIIGVIDTGIWPQNPSFSDAGLGSVPRKFKGVCSKGSDSSFKCNKKLIGARYIGKGYARSERKSLKTIVDSCGDYLSPRDIDGHGTHVASTAGGSSARASIQGQYIGIAKGAAHNARLVMYKVFWCQQYSTISDIASAIDSAVSDGVDVISLSLAGSPDLPNTLTSDLAYYFAWKATLAGVPVVFAAGNNGPYSYTVSNSPPWVMTVAAGTIDRKLSTKAVLGNGKVLEGAFVVSKGTPSSNEKKKYPLITGTSAAVENTFRGRTSASLCKTSSLRPAKVKGKIVVCAYSGDDPQLTEKVVGTAGGVGMIIYLLDDSDVNDLSILEFSFPTTLITSQASNALFNYIDGSSRPVAYILPTSVRVGPSAVEAPHVARFSSSGPNGGAYGILKPDITAPGDMVVASYPGKRWKSISGTSMAAPHVSGVIALLRSVYPTWRPSMLFSAIMTTASQLTNRRRAIKFYSRGSTPFNRGAGAVRPNAALYPGLVYPISNTGYNRFLCSAASGITKPTSIFKKSAFCKKYPSTRVLDLNLPSVVFFNIRARTTEKTFRTLKNVGPAGTYTVTIKQPTGSTLRVYPTKLTFSKGASRSYSISIRPSAASNKVKGSTGTSKGSGMDPDLETASANLYWTFGHITWSDRKGHSVRINVALNAI